VKRGSPQSRHAPGGPEPPGARAARLRTGGAVRRSTSDAALTGTSREARYEGDLLRVPRGLARDRRAGKATSTRYTSNGFGVQRSIGRIADRDARAGAKAPLAETRDLARRKRPRAVTRAGANDGERQRCAGCGPRLLTETRRAQAARASLVGIAPGGVRARGLGRSQGRERADRRYDGRVSGSWMRLSKPEPRITALASRVNAPYCLRAGGASWRRTNGGARAGVLAATVTLRGRDGFRWLPQLRAPSRTHGAGGRHPRRGAPKCGAGAGDVRLEAFAPEASRGGREPGGVRPRSATSRIDRSGRRSNRHAPFASSLSRANGGRRTRDSGARSVVHERVPSLRASAHASRAAPWRSAAGCASARPVL